MTVPRIDVMIAGAQKSGTTSIVRYLDKHPQLAVHPSAELPFFVEDERYAAGWEASYRDSYRGAKPTAMQKVLAKSAGVMFLPKAIERAYQHNAAMKLVVMMREPVARAFSAYGFLRRRGRETAPSFREALALEEERLASDFDRYHRMAYVGRGLYAEQIERLWERFGSEQVRCIVLEELAASPLETINSLCDFLEIQQMPRAELEAILATRHNEGGEVRRRYRADRQHPLVRRLVPAKARLVLRRGLSGAVQVDESRDLEAEAMLAKRFLDPNEALFGLLGRRIPTWSRDDLA